MKTQACSYDPRDLKGAPIGMFHCPKCGQMVVAGIEHPSLEVSFQDTIFESIRLERISQDKKWGVQNHSLLFWLGIITEELGEVAKSIIEDDAANRVISELVQVAAVAVAMTECMERNGMEYALDACKEDSYNKDK